jgi:O-acetyl-ADP-ribose deacetylase (regulator of RNase III)
LSELRKFFAGELCITIAERDITSVEVDAIVNAANERMLGGGGVDGAIHRAAGEELYQACERVPEVRPGVRCPTGTARITPGFRLRAKHVIHTVGPVYARPETSASLLESCHLACLELADAYALSSVAFPAISCGVYGYPFGEAAVVAVGACLKYAAVRTHLTDIHFALFGRQAYDAWLAAAVTLIARKRG